MGAAKDLADIAAAPAESVHHDRVVGTGFGIASWIRCIWDLTWLSHCTYGYGNASKRSVKKMRQIRIRRQGRLPEPWWAWIDTRTPSGRVLPY
jgi:hypothetical protein